MAELIRELTGVVPQEFEDADRSWHGFEVDTNIEKGREEDSKVPDTRVQAPLTVWHSMFQFVHVGLDDRHTLTEALGQLLSPLGDW